MSDQPSTTNAGDRQTPPADQPSPEPSPEPGSWQANLPQPVQAPGEALLDQFAAFSARVVALADEFGTLAGRGLSLVLSTAGLLMILAALATNVQTVAEQVGVLDTPEFVAVVIAGTLLMSCAAGVRLYNNHLRHQREKEIMAAGRQLLASFTGLDEARGKVLERQIELQMERYRKQQEALLDIAKENQSGL
jgi:hypothetical protein